MVIDLHHKLFKVSIADDYGYFVILQSQAGDFIAIPVITSPDLMDVRREQIRILPEPYRQSDTLSMASHVAVVPQANETLTIFIVDENALL